MGQIVDSSIDVMNHAIESAHNAYQKTWRKVDGVQRGRILLSIANILQRDKERLATIEAVDTGKPLSQARGDVDIASRYFEFYAGIADKIYGETIPQRLEEHFAYTVREPLGVVGHITPWNAPLNQLCRGVAPSLAAGNAVVVKPSEIAPYSPLVVARLFIEAGLPPGVMNVVSGVGPTVGAALVSHPLINHVSFTGSVATGQDILRRAAEKIMPCNLELGGKSPAIVFADADLEVAAKSAAMAVIRNSGQSCFSVTRFIVHRSIYDQFTNLIVREISGLTIGHALDDRQLGPLASQAQLEKVIDFLKSAKEDNVTVATGGVKPSEYGDGYFFLPTLLTNVKNEYNVAQNEIFGPVQTMIVFDDEDEAIAIANDCQYGLASGVFTKSLRIAHRVAAQIQAGQVMVNKYPLGSVDTPFGGYKRSGIGREKGIEAIRGYTQLKTVIMDLGT
jgi:aldehyde dehydrogenase (NAD+)